MRHINIAITLLAASAFTSCGLYPTYQSQADTEVVDDLYTYIEATNDTTNIATTPWREIFTDIHLQDLIEKGLENNTDLNVARLSVEQAQQSLKTARKSFLPSLSASAQAPIPDVEEYTVSVAATWEIDIFGKLRNAKRASAAALEQSVAYQQAVQTELIASIAGSYYSLLMLDKQLEISEDTQENWKENLRAMEAMLRAGRINEIAVLQSRASSIALDSSIVTIKESRSELENTLSLLIAQPTAHIERGALDDAQFPSDLAVGVPIQLLTNRPDIRMAEAELAEAFYITAQSRASLYPTVTLVGSASYVGSLEEIVWSAAAGLTQPIFFAGSLRAQLKISEAQQEQALLSFNQSILDAGAEVNNALSSWQAANERLDYGVQRLDILEKALTKTELLMKHGVVDYLDVLTAQLTLLQTDLSVATDKYNQAQSVINLYRALGGGE